MLGVPETASPAEILSAFRTRIRAVHPDLHDGTGDREVLEVLVRARQTLTGPDRGAYLEARARRMTSSARVPPAAGRSQRGPVAEQNLDFSEVFRRAAAARRARSAPPPPPPPPRPAPSVDPFVEAAHHAQRTRDEVRHTVPPTVTVPPGPSSASQPRPSPVPPVRTPRHVAPHYTRVPYERVRYERVRYEPVRYEGVHFRPSPPTDPLGSFLRATQPDGATDETD